MKNILAFCVKVYLFPLFLVGFALRICDKFKGKNTYDYDENDYKITY